MPGLPHRFRQGAATLLCVALAAASLPSATALGAGTQGTADIPGLLSKNRSAASEAPGSQAGGAVAPVAGAGSSTQAAPPTTTLQPAASGTPTTSTVPPIATGTTTPGAQVGGGLKVSTTKTTPATARGSNEGVSDGAILAAALAALIALACLVWAVFRFGAFEPHWLLSLRHSLAEAGFRASATWAEFTDWIRLGH